MGNKKAVHFGGGNIGRGFVAEFLHESGFEVVFVDVMDSIIEALTAASSYKVTEISAEGEQTKTITNYRAINSKYNMDKVIDEISTADIVTCAVGPRVLKPISGAIAKGIDKRTIEKPVAVVACENAIGATDTLRGFIVENTEESRRGTLLDRARFANSAIDRIVPTQDPDAGLNVKIEKFYEWAVEKTPFKEFGHPEISAIHWVDDLTPYIERKLYTVNTSHATAAYYGYNARKKTIHDAMSDPKILGIVKDVVAETATLIVQKHGISKEDQQKYVDAIISRISNPHLEDVVERVGRAPLRKVSRRERFIGPAAELAERGDKVDALLGAFEQALRFQDVPDDEESAKLAKLMKEMSPPELVTELTGLDKSHPLYEGVLARVEKVQKESK